MNALFLSCATESTSAAYTLLELSDLDNFRGIDAFDDELSNTVTFGDSEVGVVVVEEEDLDLAAVVGVNDTSAGVDEMLACQAGAGGDTAICVIGTWLLVLALLQGWIKQHAEVNVHVPAGTAMAISVSTRALPRAGIVVGLEA